MFAKVIVDIPDMGPLDYKVPEDMLVAVGDRVMVPLQKRYLPGVITSLLEVSDLAPRQLKSIHFVMNDVPPLRAEWLNLTKFTSQYYIKGWGESAVHMLPQLFRRAPTKQHTRSMGKIRTLAPIDFSQQPSEEPPLNDEQHAAVDDFKAQLGTGFVPGLLFGVTGSGKTEVYLRMIKAVLEREENAQVLLLVPEINLTPQLEQRVRKRFPLENVVSMHSSCTDIERARAWLAIHENRASILIGTRLSIFSSFANLKLIIVDEEHDSSFKAAEGVQYSARDLAIWRASKNKIPVVLGSATPSMETWLKVKKGDYRLWELKKRATGTTELPDIELVDNPKNRQHILSEVTKEKIQEAIAKRKQVLVFLNRRGYSPVLFCPSCGWMARCNHCSSFMVYHKKKNTLICHHCDTQMPIPRACPECGNVDILPRGLGTERLEEELDKTFPGVRLLRIDRDSVSRKKDAQEAFDRVHRQEVDILVGTQMVAKGHDFQNIDLVVVLESDALLCHPDVRAKEHLFATLMQVAGRAGRREEKGLVLLQTNHPMDPIFASLMKQDYQAFADMTLAEREKEYYVPYSCQALLQASAENIDDALAFLTTVAEKAYELAPLSVRVFDPVPMTLVKLKDKERAQLLIEGDDRRSLNHFLWQWRRAFPQTSIQWSIEVDPLII